MTRDLTAIGWVHAAIGAYALVTGARVLVAVKGGSRHRELGRRYALATVAVSLSAFGIFHHGVMSAFHWMAVATLASVVLAVVAARRQRSGGLWLRTHLTAIIFSYCMLLGGTVNQAFQRIPLLASLSPGVLEIALGTTHSVLIALFLMVVAYFWGRTARNAPIRFTEALRAKALTGFVAIMIAIPGAGEAYAATVEGVVRNIHGDAGDVCLHPRRPAEYLGTPCSFSAILPADSGDVVLRFK